MLLKPVDVHGLEKTPKELSQKRATWNYLFAIVKHNQVCNFIMANTMLYSNPGVYIG